MDRRTHWNETWTARRADGVSWYQLQPEPSLSLVRAVTGPGDPILDVGGGASGLPGALVEEGYTGVTVLDVSGAALRALETRLGKLAPRIRTLEEDVLECAFAEAAFALWHDRAVFHFLTDPDDRSRYREQLARALRRGGHAVIGTFADDGPEKCSGLPVRRYDTSTLMNELGDAFRLVQTLRHEHRTPTGVIQPFTFVVARYA